jgi:predicted Zn-dependent peptidase
LARTKNTLLTNQALLLADPAGRAREQALDELYGLGYDYYLGAAERVQKVTAERVQALAQQALALDRCAVVETRPGGDKQ